MGERAKERGEREMIDEKEGDSEERGERWEIGKENAKLMYR